MLCNSRIGARLVFLTTLCLVACALPVAGHSKGHETPEVAKQQGRLEEFLQQWSQHVGDVETFSVRFQRIAYNATFRSKTRQSGSFLYVGPHQWEYRLDDGSERLLRDGGWLFLFLSATNTVFRIDINELRAVVGRGLLFATTVCLISEAPPMPFLLGLRLDELQEKYRIEITKEDDDAIWLALHPHRKDDDQFLRRAQLLIDKETFRPRAAKLHNPNGKGSTVFVFDEMEINHPMREEEFRPHLEGWKVVSFSELLAEMPD